MLDYPRVFVYLADIVIDCIEVLGSDFVDSRVPTGKFPHLEKLKKQIDLFR